jgi:serine/threonine protein kinase
MEGIVAGTIPAPRVIDATNCEADLSADRAKLLSVFTGINVEPVVVSKTYGQHCTKNYDVANRIGVGGFGSVYQGSDLTLRRTFAFKRISLLADNPQKFEGALKTFEREISVRCFCLKTQVFSFC